MMRLYPMALWVPVSRLRRSIVFFPLPSAYALG
jgi:hypothetical protein